MKMTKIKRITHDMVPVGMYLVSFTPVWSSPCNLGEHECCMEHGCMDNEPDRISDVDAEVIKVKADNYMSLPADVRNQGEDWNTGDQYGDTHDLRPRLFKTLKEAKEHMRATVDRFRNPQPWECFVKTA